MRYTDRDCYAALIRVAGALNERGADYGVSLPTRPSWVKDLESLAETFGVPVRRWGEPSYSEGRRFILDHAPGCYGGGVRPAYCEADATGEYTPQWWKPSAGLGPGAVPRREFCHILGAVEWAVARLAEVTS